METNENINEKMVSLMVQFEIESLDLTNRLSLLALEVSKTEESAETNQSNSI